MIQINSIVLLRVAVIAIIVVLQTTGAPVQTTTQAEVSFEKKNHVFLIWIFYRRLNVSLKSFHKKLPKFTLSIKI